MAFWAASLSLAAFCALPLRPPLSPLSRFGAVMLAYAGAEQSRMRFSVLYRFRDLDGTVLSAAGQCSHVGSSV